MITELISVGTEILLGNIVNTNSAYLSEKCALLGLSVYYQDVVGDNEGRMRDVIRTALDRSDVVILTGGLGPTEDDITKEVTADLMGMPLKEDSHSRKLIDKYLKEYEKNNPQRRITKNNYKQAMVPEGAIVLDNHNGTAPGLILEKKGKTAILLPGPPNELKPMFEEYVVPYLQKNLDDIITIEDDDLIVAFLDMVENHKMIVENSGLLTVAALKYLDVKDKKVVSILSGGNMDVITMSSVVQLGLIQRDRIFTVSVLLPDKPGELVRVSQVIANENGNVIKLDHNQFFTTNRSAAVELRITMEAFGTDHKNRIVKALEEAGYTPKIVRPNL